MPDIAGNYVEGRIGGSILTKIDPLHKHLTSNTGRQ